MRKEKKITIKDRDRELTFIIREFSATEAEDFIARAVLLLLETNPEVKGAKKGSGIDTVAKELQKDPAKIIEAFGRLDYDKAKPLLNRLLSCCYRVDAGIEQQCTVETVDTFVADFTTLFKLRVEAVKHNFGFLQTALPSFLGAKGGILKS